MHARLLIGLVMLGLFAPAPLSLPFIATTIAHAQDAPDAPLPMPRLRRGDEQLPAEQLPADPGAPVAASGEVSALVPAGQAAGLPGTPATEAISAATAVPQTVHLDAKITEASPVIGNGVVWRVFDTRTDAAGELPLIAKAETAVAELSLPPGEYVVHVAYGRAQVSYSLVVAEGENAKTVVLDAGGLRLNAMIAGDIPIPSNLVRFNIYNGSEENERELVAEGLGPNDIVTLNAGTYHVVSRFGSINAVVRANLRVEPGQLTDATLFQKASQVAFKLVSEPGGEAIADIEWTVKTAAGETVFTDLGAFPSTVLAEGDYLVLAKRGTTVFNREFEVQPGNAREIEVLTTVY